MLDTLYLPCGIVLSACAADRPLIWSKPGAAEQSFNIDKFDYLKQAQENKVVIVGGVAEKRDCHQLQPIQRCMQAKGWSSK